MGDLAHLALDDDWSRPPMPEGQPVTVLVRVVVMSINAIDPLSGFATVNICVGMYWHDRRVTEGFKTAGFRIPHDLWRPSLALPNGVDEEKWFVSNRHANQDVRWYPNDSFHPNGLGTSPVYPGTCRMLLPYVGLIENIMDLRAFPFDEDSIDFRFVGSRFRSGETATEKELILKCRSTEFVRCYFSRHLHEYEIQGVSYINYCARGFSYIVWGISLRRMFSYYFYKVTLLMWLIAGISMQVFLFSTEELEQRQELAATMFLATAATLYVIQQELPKLNFMNRMDKLLLSTLFLLFLVLVETAVVFSIEDRDVADQMDLVCGVGLAFSYAIYSLVLFVPPLVGYWFCSPAVPKHVPPERNFIAWKHVPKVNPWVIGDLDNVKMLKGADADVMGLFDRSKSDRAKQVDNPPPLKREQSRGKGRSRWEKRGGSPEPKQRSVV
eukprot:g670.t1